jgi:predicted amidohydrolase YtcJ
VAIKNDKIVVVGTDQEIKKLAGERTNIIAVLHKYLI